jgi:hypothetical protein
MRARAWLAGGLFLAALTVPAVTPGAGPETPTNIAWKKTVLDTRFLAEGVAIADVNKDGKMDVLNGELWYEAPNWKQHRIRPGKDDYTEGDKNVYSESFCCWADDFNGDGWPDLIVIPFPGKAAHWYENPKGQDGMWKEHEIWPSACNETPQYADLFGTGKRVLIMAWQPPGKEDQGQMAWFAPGKDPTQPWEMHPISEPSAPPGKIIPGTFRFSHGLGVGDLNGDGRNDVICTDGWWEQPEKPDGQTPWKFHPAKLGEACADMYAFDMDGDGRADVLSSSAHKFGIWWYQQRGDKENPEFIKNDLFREMLSETHALHFVDINGDGMKDLVTGKRWWSHGRAEPGSDWPAMLYWFEASRDKNGLVHFRPHVIDTDSGVGTQFAVADINGDGLLDVITANKKGVFIHEQVRSPGSTRATDK